jgi:hypothetical protein
MFKRLTAGLFLLGIISLLFVHSSCKSCKKEEKPVTTDSTTTTTAPPPVANFNIPHADSSLIPVFTEILTTAFEASAKKDYNKLASLIVYRGPDAKRYGYDVFNAKNAYDRKAVSITADVFNKWTRNVENIEYARVFALDQPDGRTLPVMEVIFISPKYLDRKFFGFLEINGEYKIADVTANLQVNGGM